MWWRWLSVGYSVLAAAFVILAIAPGRSTTNRVLAVCWVGLAVFYWWTYAVMRRRNTPADDRPEGGA